MIRIFRGKEPAALTAVRSAQLALLRSLGRQPRSDEIDGYKVVADDLWRAQHFKCCYCEFKVRRSYNDVEHYRPKARADRRPGCNLTHGYWWLAFTWENLLFACPSCNRSSKNDNFPVNKGSITLRPEAMPPGRERPLLICPAAGVNPVLHIHFLPKVVNRTKSITHWYAIPRNGSLLGRVTIKELDLNNSELLELRKDYYDNTLSKEIEALKDALTRKQIVRARQLFDRALALFNPKQPFVALSFDAMRWSVPNKALRAVLSTTWPRITQIGRRV